MDQNTKVITVICANEPVPLLVKKIELLNRQPNINVRLIYLHRKGSLINMPLSVDIPDSQIHKIELSDPHGSIFKRTILQFLFMIKVLWILYQIKPAAVHAVNMENWLLLHLLYLRKTKYVLDIQDVREIFFNSVIKIFIRFFLKKTDIIFVASPKFADDYLYGLSNNLEKNKVLFVPNAPYEAEFARIKKRRRSSLTIGYFGFLRGREAIHSLIDAVAQLNQEGLDIRVHFAGIGIERPLVENYARQYDFIKYFGPYNYRQDIQNLYQDIDLIYAVYLVDNDKRMALGCRYSESIVTGIPLIVQADTYMADLVQQYETGYLINFGDWKSLKDLLQNLYHNREDIDRVAQNCDAIRADNLFDAYIPVIINAYNRLLSNA